MLFRAGLKRLGFSVVPCGRAGFGQGHGSLLGSRGRRGHWGTTRAREVERHPSWRDGGGAEEEEKSDIAGTRSALPLPLHTLIDR